MSDLDDREIRKALERESRATFDDLRRRLDADRPGPCEELAAEITALATGAREPAAERHVAECARCRDRVDAARDVWNRLERPVPQATFADLKPRLAAPLPLRVGRAVAAALLAAAVAGAFIWPAGTPVDGRALAGRLEEDGLSLKAIADLGTERAARTLIAAGGPEAESLLVGMMGRRRKLDEIISRALTGGAAGAMHPAELVRDWRPDLLPALIDAAPPGSALTLIPALLDPNLAPRAAGALERLPYDEVAVAFELAGVGASPDEAACFAEWGVAVSGALKAATRSRDHRSRCFWSALADDDGVEFLLAAAGTTIFREDALMYLGLLPDEVVRSACLTALRDPELAAGAARAAVRLGDPRLIPALMKAAHQPPAWAGPVGFEIEDGSLISARSESLESVCLEAVAVLNRR